MSILVTNKDFTGKFKINQNCYSELDKYIDKYEKQYLQDLLGCELFDLFNADLLNGVPQTQRFIDIFNAFCEDDGSCIWRSEGMKEMVLGFIYFEYVRDSMPKVTPNGVKSNKVETAMNAEFGVHDIYTRYNESIDTYCSIQWYIDENASSYPEENMQFKSKVSRI